MKYELFYGLGGHGGPYPNLKTAVSRAKDLLIGSPTEVTIKVVSHKDWATWPKTFPYCKITKTVKKCRCGKLTVERG